MQEIYSVPFKRSLSIQPIRFLSLNMFWKFVWVGFDSLYFFVGRKIFLILLCSHALWPGFYRIAIFNQLMWFVPYLAPIVTQKSLHSLAHPLCIDQSKNWSGSRPDSILSAPVRYSTRWTCKKRWWTNLTCLIWTSFSKIQNESK